LIFLICAVSLLVSGLTLFSGFGLGTILMPAFALFFPVETAVAMTAIVHFSNNLFKLALLGRKADWRVTLRFGLPAMLAAFLGARMLVGLSQMTPLFHYMAFNRVWQVTALKLVVAALMAGFALFESMPSLARISFSENLLPVGGLLSGFFGGLSGQQGALRSAFLVRCGLSKEAFIGTGVVIACAVDTVRLFVYSERLRLLGREELPLVAAACVCAWAGAFFGARLLHKVTMRAVQLLVAGLLFLVAAGLAGGLI
jgi:uncharacterized membrane protein YfcA